MVASLLASRVLTLAQLIAIAFPLIACQPGNEQPIIPDWSRVTRGNWSPWVDDVGGHTWDPVRSFNTWVESIPEEDNAWPVVVDVYYEFQSVIRSETRGVMTDELDPDPEWHRTPKHREQRIAALADPAIQAAIERLIEASNRPHFAAGYYEYTDPHVQRTLTRLDRVDEIVPRAGSEPKNHLVFAPSPYFHQIRFRPVLRLLFDDAARLTETERRLSELEAMIRAINK